MKEDGEDRPEVRECRHHQNPTGSHQRPPTKYWWPNQRFMDEVFPANTFSVADMDRKNYSYQLYAHPGIQNSDDLRASQMASKSCYNIRRVAVDRPYGTRNGTECQQLHWANKPWVMERDCTGHNNGGDAKQPITPLNPFAAKSDPTPGSDQSHTTCASSVTGSTSRTSVSSCSRRKGFNDNKNNNHFENVTAAVTRTGSGITSRTRVNNRSCQENNNDNQNNSHGEIFIGAVENCVPHNDVNCGGRSQHYDQKCTSSIHTENNLPNVTPLSYSYPGGSKNPDPCDISPAKAKGAVACNAFLHQLALPSEIRDPKTAPAHCTIKGHHGGIGKQRSRDKLSHLPICSIENTNETRTHSASRRKVNPGYGTYKIIGGHQYRERPQEDPRVNMQLPLHLSQYREYQRRCPRPRLGIYDRADPDNEMILPAHRNTTLLKASRSPFTFLRNPKPHRKMAANCQHQNEAKKSDIPTLQWTLPSFL